MDKLDLSLDPTEIERELSVSKVWESKDWEEFLPHPIELRRAWLDSRREYRYYYSYTYERLGAEGHPAFINAAKNDDADWAPFNCRVPKPIPLYSALRCVYQCFVYGAQGIVHDRGWLSGNIALCLVPRAKKEECYYPNQLGIKLALRMAIRGVGLLLEFGAFQDGISYDANLLDRTDAVKRVKHTATTHRGGGKFRGGIAPVEVNPYVDPQWTFNSCEVDPSIWDADYIILVDDIYTPGNPIDPDCLEMIVNAHPDLKSGRVSKEELRQRIVLYTLARTRNRHMYTEGDELI